MTIDKRTLSLAMLGGQFQDACSSTVNMLIFVFKITNSETNLNVFELMTIVISSYNSHKAYDNSHLCVSCSNKNFHVANLVHFLNIYAENMMRLSLIYDYARDVIMLLDYDQHIYSSLMNGIN